MVSQVKKSDRKENIGENGMEKKMGYEYNMIKSGKYVKTFELILKLKPEDVLKPSTSHHQNHPQLSHLLSSEVQHMGKKLHICYGQHKILIPPHIWHALCECPQNVTLDFDKPAHPQ